jgi:hypothetical protein
MITTKLVMFFFKVINTVHIDLFSALATILIKTLILSLRLFFFFFFSLKFQFGNAFPWRKQLFLRMFSRNYIFVRYKDDIIICTHINLYLFFTWVFILDVVLCVSQGSLRISIEVGVNKPKIKYTNNNKM